VGVGRALELPARRFFLVVFAGAKVSVLACKSKGWCRCGLTWI
jgi:hypothetical protein